MRITAEISMYPLREAFVDDIRDFILRLRDCDEIEVLTNQLSTQLRGQYDEVHAALQACMRESMERAGSVVFVVKYLNADLPIATEPKIHKDG